MNASAGPRYFETMRTPLVQGREFTDHDQNGSELVAVVDETFVKKMLTGVSSPSEAIGKRISFGSAAGPYMRIVGGARAGKYFNIAEDPRPIIWTPMAQDYNSSGILTVRTEGAPEPLLAAVRKEVQALDPNLPLFDVKTLSEHMRFALFPARVAAAVLGVFGIVALLLSAIGIYGITSYTVAQRTHEIGIRLALGAQLSDVLSLVLCLGLKLTAIGAALGLLGAYLATRAITSVLYGVSPTDPFTFGLVSLLLIGVALLACYVPSRRATKVDPLIALRSE
jgi:predicted permease